VDFIDFERPTTCPYCGKVNPLAGNVRGPEAPADGDVSLCIGCGHWGVFEAGAPGGMRKTTPLEAARMAGDEDIARVRLAWLVMDQRRRAEG
jgi:hypothetical protein